MEELKPCPFCGGKAFINIEYGYWCECYRCGACTDKYKTQAKAVEAWDKRHYEAFEENGFFILPKPKDELFTFSTEVVLNDAGKITLNERIDIIREALDRWKKELGQEMAQKLFETFRPTCTVVKEKRIIHSTFSGNKEVIDEKCSECGGYMETGFGVMRNYCPNCGAKVVR